MKTKTTSLLNVLQLTAFLLGLALLAPQPGQAALLPLSSWTARDVLGNPVAQAQDNNLATGALLQSPQATVRCVIDLGSTTTVHRLFFTSTRTALDPAGTSPEITSPRALTVTIRIGSTATTINQVLATRAITCKTGREILLEGSLRFAPASGRFLSLEVDRGSLSNPWNVSEVEVYGWAGNALAERRDAVVLPASAPAPLQLAAAELSYYVGELSGHPVPTILAEQAGSYPGTIFRIIDLKPFAQTYEQMTNNLATGVLPATPVNVEREGREVIFRAWPYRNVLWSVWEFLDRQGIKWVYADAHGDFVPAGAALNLEVAPLQFTPATDFIYANFGVEYLRDDPDAFLHFWRNRWSHTWGGHQRDALGGSEIPQRPFPNVVPKAEYTEGFAGYPHNFRTVLPDRILAQHPNWCGMLTNQMWASWLGEANLGKRMLPSQNWATFDMTNPEAQQFIIDKAIYMWNEHAKYNGNIYWMLPDDGMLFSEDPASVSMRQPLQGDRLPYAFPYPHVVSGDYYDFICHIAEGIQEALPEAKVGAMAYSNTHLAPTNRASAFPSNVLVDICQYGARNLPMSSPKNAEMRQRLLDWASLASDFRRYDYDLIHSESGALRMPVPLVSAIADRADFMAQHGMLAGGTQADLDSRPYNPWNYYAYPRFYWNAELTTADVMQEFFSGYYLEAAAPLQSYYSTLERYLLANNVSLQGRGYDYGMVVGAFPLNVLKKMQQHLQRAESLATYWVTRERVAFIRQGFDWILERRGLTYADLATLADFPRVSPGSPVSIDPRTAAIQTAGQDVGDAWYMFSWAQVGEYIYFEKAGRYQITIEAGMGYSDTTPRDRYMMFHIGAQEYGPYLIDHENVETYTLYVEVLAGVMEVAVEDLFNDSPFKVRSINVVYMEGAPPPSPRLLTTVDRVFDYAGEASAVSQIDSDWDGAPDLHELLAGTDELDPEQYFAARCLIPTATGLCITWSSVEGKRYALYRATQLDGEYTLVADDVAATPPENQYADASASGTAFYQISVY